MRIQRSEFNSIEVLAMVAWAALTGSIVGFLAGAQAVRALVAGGAAWL